MVYVPVSASDARVKLDVKAPAESVFTESNQINSVNYDGSGTFILQAKATLGDTSTTAATSVTISVTGLYYSGTTAGLYNIIFNYVRGTTATTYTGSTVGSVTANTVGSGNTAFTVPTGTAAGTYTVQLVAVSGTQTTAGTAVLALPPTITITTAAEADTEVPTITHTAVTSAVAASDLSISATVTDNVEVSSVTLYYRITGATSYTSVAMSATASTYSASIPAASVTSTGVEYYIVAVDSVPNEATSGTATSPNSVTVTEFASETSSAETQTTDSTGAAKTEFGQGGAFLAHTKITNIGSEDKVVVYAIRITDPDGTVLAPIVYSKTTVGAGKSVEPETEYALPADAKMGTWKFTVLVYTDYIRNGGVLSAEPVTYEFTVVSG